MSGDEWSHRVAASKAGLKEQCELQRGVMEARENKWWGFVGSRRMDG